MGKVPEIPEVARRDGAGRFTPGASGNPVGKPKTEWLRIDSQKELFRHGPELVQLAVERAIAGDKRMHEFLLTRILPELKPASVEAEEASQAEKVKAWTVAELQARQGKTQ